MEDREIKKTYNITKDKDKTLKQFFDRFYIIPKNDADIPEDILKFLENNKVNLLNKDVANGKNGYIVFRGKKKFKAEQIEMIKADKSLTQRQLAKKYNCGVGTINRILNDKY